MRFMILANRNFKEVWLDPLSIGLVIGLPVGLLLMFQPIGKLNPFFTTTNLAPGLAVYAFTMLTFSSGMILARDRESALLSRLLNAPLRANDFISAYSLPYIPIAIIQIALVFGVGRLLGLEISGNAGLVFLVIFVMSIGYIGLGMILGSLLSSKQVPLVWTAVNLLTIFGGAWVPLEALGGAFQRAMKALPFAHTIDAARAIMVDGVGFSNIAVDLYWVIGYTLVFFALGTILFRRRMVE